MPTTLSPDAYRNPRTFNLRRVGQFGTLYDALAVWQHDDGRLFYDTTLGYPATPFGHCTSIDVLSPITPATWAEFSVAVAHHGRDRFQTGDDPYAVRRAELLADVRRLLADQVLKEQAQ